MIDHGGGVSTVYMPLFPAVGEQGGKGEAGPGDRKVGSTG